MKQLPILEELNPQLRTAETSELADKGARFRAWRLFPAEANMKAACVSWPPACLYHVNVTTMNIH